MEIATRNVIVPGSVGLAQAHPLTKPPAMREQPSAGLGPLGVHPTHLGVGPSSVRGTCQKTTIAMFSSVYE